MKTTRRVIVTLRRVGFHQWHDAPDQVMYLREAHRHEFRIRVEKVVAHDDRATEFHILKQSIEKVLDHLFSNPMALGERSCEMVATELIEYMASRFMGTPVNAVEVWEDGENGARVEAELP